MSTSGKVGFVADADMRQRGKTASFLDNKGFGWLMEVEDDDEEDKKPLL